MENWELRRARYADAGRLGDQAFEDMLGRRILRGLGCTEKQIHKLERFVLGSVNAELPLWTRASGLFLELLKRRPEWAYLPLGWHLETLHTGRNADKEVLELLDMFESERDPVFFAMPKSGGEAAGAAYSLWDAGLALRHLKPPYRVVALDVPPGKCLVAQDASHFVAQFGPYEHMQADE